MPAPPSPGSPVNRDEIRGEAATRPVVNARSGELCERCGKPGHSIHHRRNVSQGGPWTPQNCVRLCGHGTVLCHGWVTEHPTAAHQEGLTLHHGEDPATTPITHHLYGPVLLDPYGGYTLI